MHMKYDFYSKFRMIIFHDQKTLLVSFKSSRLQMFFKIGVLKNFTMFKGKHLCWSYFLIQLQGWRPAIVLKRDFNTGALLWILQNLVSLWPATLLKKRPQHRCFPVNITKCLRIAFFMEHLRCLLLKMVEEFLIQLEKYLYRRIYKRERFVKTFCGKWRHGIT